MASEMKNQLVTQLWSEGLSGDEVGNHEKPQSIAAYLKAFHIYLGHETQSELVNPLNRILGCFF